MTRETRLGILVSCAFLTLVGVTVTSKLRQDSAPTVSMAENDPVEIPAEPSPAGPKELPRTVDIPSRDKLAQDLSAPPFEEPNRLPLTDSEIKVAVATRGAQVTEPKPAPTPETPPPAPSVPEPTPSEGKEKTPPPPAPPTVISPPAPPTESKSPEAVPPPVPAPGSVPVPTPSPVPSPPSSEPVPAPPTSVPSAPSVPSPPVSAPPVVEIPPAPAMSPAPPVDKPAAEAEKKPKPTVEMKPAPASSEAVEPPTKTQEKPKDDKGPPSLVPPPPPGSETVPGVPTPAPTVAVPPPVVEVPTPAIPTTPKETTGTGTKPDRMIPFPPPDRLDVKPPPAPSLPPVPVEPVPEVKPTLVTPAPSVPSPASAAPSPRIEPKPVETPLIPMPTPTVATPTQPKPDRLGGQEPSTVAPSLTARPIAVSTPSATLGQPIVESFSEEELVARTGDSYATVAKAKYGSESYAEALRLYNRNDSLLGDMGRTDRAELKPGDTLSLPQAHILEKRYGHVIPGLKKESEAKKQTLASAPVVAKPVVAPVVYTVPEGGESIYVIASQTLGRGDRWGEILQLNPQWTPEKPIPGGIQLRLPADARIGSTPR